MMKRDVELFLMRIHELRFRSREACNSAEEVKSVMAARHLVLVSRWMGGLSLLTRRGGGSTSRVSDILPDETAIVNSADATYLLNTIPPNP
ncbi:hypothetical protein CORC01_12877 [Colletotrichum orchidophilum]|uniref:Uncharacterized protein n=1 Tax=Colletotrichum orchidophilum TaxID=1209926 RepID=A0A1G4ARU1_9PEZI|nr:uncharacterized protein CORC01_12877 [Colletotrichum orchidophilum]OHE91803.1 hypothetical protein CORC01_12877 [Colletotrichum orchidophilum]